MIVKLLAKNELNTYLQGQLTELYKELNAELRQVSLETIFEHTDQIDVAVCLIENTLIGIAMMARYKVVSGYKGMIEDVVVASEYREQGIGRKLMEKLLEQAEIQELDDVLLFSGHHRTAAISLYASLGFTRKESGLYIKKYLP